MKKKRITIEQVAEHAGVSKSTVSLIVRGSTSISEATRNKVMHSIKELGYVYDRVAANLRSQNSKTVGVIISDIANPFFSDMLVGVHRELEKDGYTVLLGTTFESMEKQENLLAAMMENRVAGIILIPVSGRSNDTIRQVNQWGIPIVIAGKNPQGTDCDFVGTDNVKGAQMAVNHLLQKGHQRIAFVGGSADAETRKEREQGYRNAFQQAGLEVDESLLVFSPASSEGGYDAIQRLLRRPNPPTAVFCYNDVVAFGAMLWLKENGIVPGQDMAIVGFDNIKEGAMFYPGLTTVSSSPRLIGIHSANLLNQRMNGLESESNRIILQPELVVRNSCSYAFKV